MTASKSLPARPSLESLRKQAKKLARDIAAGDAAAIARVRAHLPHVDLPLAEEDVEADERRRELRGWTLSDALHSRCFFSRLCALIFASRGCFEKVKLR